MLLLITFILVWALSPGPVLIMTISETRKHGSWAGIAVAAGATVTSLLMVIAALCIHSTRFTEILNSGGVQIIERIGALMIIWFGVAAAYKSLWHTSVLSNSTDTNQYSRTGFVQGMLMMATYIPQALIFYNMIIPQTVGPTSTIMTILVVGSLKVILIFAWHAGAAVITTSTRKLLNSTRLEQGFGIASACLIMWMGVNILL